MTVRDQLPMTVAAWRLFSGRVARRLYAALVLLLLVVMVTLRVHAFLVTRSIESVMLGLSKLTIDQSTEQEAFQAVPQLSRSNWELHVGPDVERGDVEEGIERNYFVSISNQRNWMRAQVLASRFPGGFTDSPVEGWKNWVLNILNFLGYRYIDFGATVRVFNGRVSSISYRIDSVLGFDGPATVSVRSAHAYWMPHQVGFEVSSTDDENLQFLIHGADRHLNVIFTPDATSTLKVHAFSVDLSCFWLGGCTHSSQIVPLLWQDKVAMEKAALARLTSNNPCPDKILADRVKYLPDVATVLLESVSSRNESVNQDGRRVDEIWTDYKVVNVIRGRLTKSWASVRSNWNVPYPGDYSKSIRNMGSGVTKTGERAIAFDNFTFDSCGVVRATPSALSAVQDTSSASRRFEDQNLGRSY